MGRFVVLVVLAGCEIVFPLDPPDRRADANLEPRPCFEDNFDGPVVDESKWSVIDPTSPATVDEPNVELRISLAANVDAYNGIQSAQLHDITGATVTVFAQQTASFDGFTETTMMIDLDADNRYYVSVGGASGISFVGIEASVRDAVTMPYVPTIHRWWSMRHVPAPGRIEFATSADLATWTPQHTTSAIDVRGMTIKLFGGTYMGGRPDPGQIQLDDLELTPPGCVR